MSVGKLQSIGAISRDTPLGTEKAERRDPRVDSVARDPRVDNVARDPRVDEVAKLYEKQFLREMVKAMRGTVSHSELTKPNMAENIYKEQLDEQYVDSWGERGGIGLADLIYNELMEKFISPGANKESRPQGPIALTDRDILRVTRLSSQTPRQAPLKVEIKGEANGTPAKVQSPWDGNVLAQTRVDGRSTVLLEHEGGVRSALIFDGVPTALKPGERVQGGTPIGILSPEIKSFFWNLSSSPATGLGAKELDVKTDQAKNSGPETTL